jgi:hypothetical protein
MPDAETGDAREFAARAHEAWDATFRSAPGYPLIVPQVVIDHMERFFRPAAVQSVLNRPADLFGGKSPIAWVADGDGTWEQVLTKYEVMFSYQVTA